MGESTEGMVESTAKLRDMIKAMTGFDIMEDEETFKSIYDIIVGIGEKWADLSDIQQASLLEKLAGKTQANALASAFNNIDILKEAYATAEESAGSAMQEQAHFAEGIQYSINQFNASVEALSHTLLDSGLLKFFVDLGTTGVQALDKLTQKMSSIPAIITGIVTAMSFVKGENFFTKPVEAVLGYTSNVSKLTKSRGYSNRSEFAKGFVGNFLSGKGSVPAETTNANSILEHLQKSGVDLGLYEPTIEELQQVSQQLGIVGDEAAQAAHEMIQVGVAGSKAGQQAQKPFKDMGNLLKNIGETALSIGTTMLVSFALTQGIKAIDAYINRYKDGMRELRDSKSNIDNAQKELASLRGEYDTVQHRIEAINKIGGAKLVKDGEKEKLEAQSKELERQIALKEASIRADVRSAYEASKKAGKGNVESHDNIDIQALQAGMTREEYLRKHSSMYGGDRTRNKTSVDKAIDNEIKWYDALIEKQKEYQEQVDNLTHDEQGKYSRDLAIANGDELEEARKKLNEYKESADEARNSVLGWYADIKDRADVLQMYEDYGYQLSEADKATIKLADDTKAQIDAMDEASDGADNASNSQGAFKNSVVKTTEQIQAQKAQIDSLVASYKEIFSLATRGDGLDVQLDADQLMKYGSALEYVNGNYKLNAEKLFELAEARNKDEIAIIQQEKEMANMNYLKNIKDIETYNKLLEDGQTILADGSSIRKHIADLQDQNKAIVQQNQIADYNISQLENVTSAYQKWLAVSGQEVDAKAFTGVQDASKSILELLEKGKVGLDSYKMAVDFIVPDGPDREDEASIQKYVKKLQPYFNGERSGVEKFMTDSSYFEGDVKNGFTLKEGTSVADIAKDMNWTIEVTRAMIDQLETYGGEFKWNIDGMFSDTDKLVHYQEELAKINEEKETFNMDDLSDADSERLDELNKQADSLIKKIDELQGKVNKTTFDKINKGVEDSGGVDAVHKGYEQLVELGADQQTISDYVKKTTGVTTPQEVQLYTDEAQKNVEALTTQLDTLKEKYESGELALSYDDYQQKVQDLTDQIQEQGFMVQMLNEVLLEDAGVSTEETVSKIASILTEISGYVGTIAAREPEEKPSGDDGKGNTGGGGKPVFNSNDFNGELPEGLQDTHVVYTLEADTSNAEEGLETTTDAAKKAEGPWSIKLGEAGGSLIKSTLDSISAKIRTLKSQKHIINIGIQTTGSVPKMGGLNDEVSAKGNVFANGNAFARGNDIVGEQGRELVVDPHKGIWYTVGNSGTEMIDLPEDAIVYSHNQTEALLKSGVTTRGKSTGRSFADGTLVGERGRELIVDPNIGQWYTVGENGSEMIDLPKDAIVYNHQQTEDLLKNGHTSRGHSTGASFASGNAYVRVEGTDGDGNGRSGGKDTTGGRVPGRPSTVTKSSANAAKAAEKAAKSAEEAAKNAKEDAEDAKESIDWIERALEYQNDQIKKWKDVVDDDYEPYSNRFNALEGYKNQLIEQEEILTEALHRRNEKFEEDSKKLTDAIGEEKAQVILERVLKGDVDPGEWLQKFQDEFGAESGEKIYKIVVDLQTDNKNIESTKDAIHENAKAIRDAEQEAFKMRLNIIKAAKDDLDYEMDVLEHNLDMKDVLGRMVVEADYQEMIDLTDDMADNLREQRDVLEEQLDSLEEGSQEWYNCKQEINSVNKELMECEKQQAEWNDKIMRLPIERIDRYINMLNNIKKDLENWSAEQNVLGIDTTAKTIEQRFDIAQRAIKKYNEQVDKYRDLLSHYEYGSDKFEETANSIQDCEDNVSSLIQEMRELNIQFLKLPIDDITKANEKLQNINAAEQRVLDDYDTALSAVLSKFDQLIDKRNDEIDILNKRYDEMIKPYQDQLDLLNEQNEAKQMQYNIDKAQYDLDKARQQKNVQVVRNGRIEYDSDIDALKSAQDNLNNAKHDKAVYDLQQQIDALEKERDSKIEPLEKEIDKLEDARNRWQTFEDERTFEKEAAEAVRLLGANWEKAIEGTITNPHSDDREYDIFSKNHIQLDRQITNNEKQIENNERMIDLMTRYVDAYMSGEMTYEEARSQYDKLYKDYQSGATLTSQESLAAELAFNRAKDMGDALRLNNAETKKSYDSFLGQLEKANEYNKTIDKYTKTWDEINESITKQLAELERLAALAEEIAAQRRSSGGGRSSSGSDGDGGEWSKNPTGYGAGTKYNPYGKGTLYEGDAVFTGKSIYIDNSGGDTTVESKSTEVKSSSSSSKSSGKSHYNHSSASGPASDPELHADGLAGGIIGNIPPTEKFKKLQAMGLKPLEPDEVPAFLHVGEGVVNAIQQSNILKSVGNAFKAGVMSSVPTDAVKSVENNYQLNMTFGDLNLPDVRNVDDFAKSMRMNFESAMNQQFSKIFNQ